MMITLFTPDRGTINIYKRYVSRNRRNDDVIIRAQILIHLHLSCGMLEKIISEL